MIKSSKLCIISMLSFAFTSSIVFGNSNSKEVLDTATVKQQLDYVIKKSTTYEQYKVIKTVWVNKLKKNILDSLAKSNQALQLSQNEVEKRQNSIDSLSFTLAETESQLTTITREKDSVRFLGFLITKSSYNGVMTGIITVLTLLLGVVIFLYRRSNAITSKIRLDLNEVREEFETHRKTSREREEKMARRHLDEILKYKNKKQSNQLTVK